MIGPGPDAPHGSIVVHRARTLGFVGQRRVAQQGLAPETERTLGQTAADVAATHDTDGLAA
jgi:hypothetical protein